ncbi:MAG: hypothetical protein H8E44_31720 [Planctomycetes bacterium]|nr:hypothetical protein [Planctomycetota bacterium]
MRRRRRKGLDWLRLNALSNFRLAPILVRIVVSFFIPVTNASIDAGYQHAVAVIMAMTACDTGRRQIYDHEKREIREG